MPDAVDRIVEQWAQVEPNLDVSTLQVIGRLSRVSQMVDASIARTLAEHGLQPGWYDVLATLRRSGGDCELNTSAMLDTMMLTSGAITKRIDRLVELGLVSRRPDPADGRGVLVRLTEEGRARLDAATVDHLANHRRMLAGLSERQRGDLTRLLRAFAGSIGDAPEPGAPT